jgi:hypothetical protein
MLCLVGPTHENIHPAGRQSPSLQGTCPGTEASADPSQPLSRPLARHSAANMFDQRPLEGKSLDPLSSRPHQPTRKLSPSPLLSRSPTLIGVKHCPLGKRGPGSKGRRSVPAFREQPRQTKRCLRHPASHTITARILQESWRAPRGEDQTYRLASRLFGGLG